VSRRPGVEALAPFFRIIAEGLSGLVDGADFFDMLAEDAVFEYVVSVPGYPRRVVGREAVAQLYRGYGRRSFCTALTSWPSTTTARPQSSSSNTPSTAARSTPGTPTTTTLSPSSRSKTARSHWRDYLDPIAVFDAVGWPARHNYRRTKPTVHPGHRVRTAR
jgi:uncharacterized protein